MCDIMIRFSLTNIKDKNAIVEQTGDNIGAAEVSYFIILTAYMHCGLIISMNNNFVEVQNVQEADRPSEGFYIRSGITVVLKNSVIGNGTII